MGTTLLALVRLRLFAQALPELPQFQVIQQGKYSNIGRTTNSLFFVIRLGVLFSCESDRLRLTPPLKMGGDTRHATFMKPRQIEVDISALCSINHVCDSCAGHARPFCCGQYEICISEGEIAKIDGFIAEASRDCPDLATEDGYENVIEPVDDGLYCIDENGDGQCVFAYAHGDEMRCSLHSAALRLDAPIPTAKPRSCLLWPLAISGGRAKTLSVVDDAMTFHCNSRRRSGAKTLHPSVIEILDDVFGKPFRDEVVNAAQQARHKITLPLPDALSDEP